MRGKEERVNYWRARETVGDAADGFRVTETEYHFLTEAGLVLLQVEPRDRYETGKKGYRKEEERRGRVVTNRTDDWLVDDNIGNKSNLVEIESEISIRKPDEDTQAKLSVSSMCRKLGFCRCRRCCWLMFRFRPLIPSCGTLDDAR